jgi:hypothetical protein
MPVFSPQLVQVMRSALEEVMTRVPVEYATPATKELVVAAADQIQAVLLMLM